MDIPPEVVEAMYVLYLCRKPPNRMTDVVSYRSRSQLDVGVSACDNAAISESSLLCRESGVESLMKTDIAILMWDMLAFFLDELEYVW